MHRFSTHFFFAWMPLLLLTAGVVACSGKGGYTGRGSEDATSENANAVQSDSNTVKPDSTSRLEVYYFRFSRKCTTCEAVSSVTEAYLKKQYKDGLKNGSISFTEVNLENNEGRLLAERMGVEGQTLLLCGRNEKRIDLTAKGFRYAANRPEAFKEALRQGIDSLLR